MSHRYKRNRELQEQERIRAQLIAEMEPYLEQDYHELEAKMDAFFERHPEIDVAGWIVHFDDMTEDATCEDCADYPEFCPGGDEPLKCFAGQKFYTEFVSSQGRGPNSFRNRL